MLDSRRGRAMHVTHVAGVRIGGEMAVSRCILDDVSALRVSFLLKQHEVLGHVERRWA